MKVRNTSYANPYGGVAGSTAAERSDKATDAPTADPSAPASPADVATVMGIPEAELTPKVREAIGQLMAEVQNLRQEIDRAQRRVDHLEQLADQDTLTPVLNRRAFVRELSRIMAFSERYGASSAVIYFDVNDLKVINDSHGHAAGDAALNHVARILIDHVRGSDIVGRLGGDEFGVILAQADSQEAASKSKSLSDAIQSEPLDWEGNALPVRASYGVHMLAAGQEAQEALDAADRAMYAQKRTQNSSFAGG